MKKIFTLIAVAAMAISANAQTTKIWDMAAWENADVTAEVTIDGLTYYGESKSAYAAGNATITKEGTDYNFTGRVKLGGGSTFKTDNFSRVFAFDATKGDVVTVFFTHGSSSGDPRSTYLSQEPSSTNKDVNTAFASKSVEPSGKDYVEGIVPADGKVYVWCDNNNGIYAIYRSTSGDTGINTAKIVTEQNSKLYNAAGQKVDKSYKGIVIQNGRKFVNK